jgi:hypothetical protein
MRQTETRTEIIELGDDGVLRCTVKATDRHDLEDARENVGAASEMAGGRRMPLLLDMRQARNVSREARAHYSGDENAPNILALAMLIDSPLGVVIGNFFLKVNRPPYPLRLFRNEREAEQWLRATSMPPS